MKKIKFVPLMIIVTAAGALIGVSAAEMIGGHLLLWASVTGLTALSASLTTLLLRRPRRHRPHWSTSLLKAELEPLPQPITSLFLYNTLHNISALIQFDTDKAGATLENLANLVRTCSDLSKHRQTLLGEEFKAVDLYLAIEQARLGERLIVLKNISTACLEVPFPSLALLPLVINCVRYGAELQMNPVTTAVICRTEKDLLFIEISDSMASPEGQSAPMPQREETFKLTQQRLRNYFGASVECERVLLPQYGERITISISFPDAMVPRFASEYIDQV